MKQAQMFAKKSTGYGGSLMTKAQGRIGPRPLATRYSMHLVLRSSKAKGGWSFKKRHHEKKIDAIIARFSKKYAVKILSFANAGNHLHLQMQLSNRLNYAAFIRAITSSIAMSVSGANRWNPMSHRKIPAPASIGATSAVRRGPLIDQRKTPRARLVRWRFWDRRPFTTIVTSHRYFLALKKYIQLNRLEGYGHSKSQGRIILEWLEACESG